MAIICSKLNIYVLINVFLCVTSMNGMERKIVSILNPECTTSVCNETFLVHVAAIGPNDTLHYLWDLTHKPSLLLALTSSSANLTIDWENYGNESAIKFTEKPFYCFGVVINKIWEYNDVNDTGIFNQKNSSSSYVRELNPENFAWKKLLYKTDSRSTTFSVISEQYKDETSTKNGSVLIELRGFGYLGHSEDLPHLLHTPNTSQVDIILDKLTPEENFNSSRFAMELVLVGSDKDTGQEGGHVQILARKSLDDEHAPGVFTLVDVETPQSSACAQGGYLQWRPVAYISPLRDIANSTETNVYNPSSVAEPAGYLVGSLLPSFFSFNGSLLVQATNISFGLKEDGFYRKTNYLAWTFTVGYGKPPDEDFSLLVILVISIGLGLPALLVAVSGLIMLLRRLSQRKDDLFQGR